MANVLGIKVAEQHKQLQKLIEENKKLKDTIEVLHRENSELQTRLSAKESAAVDVNRYIH